ncbi:fibroin heavy chain isoform X3 [Xyrichtys novacula]|uniref:Fibroin heavy chain isoform X3 n=1 Tax=Xyrichtys novacula TaxID=13765 RepID=A0AAV1GR37_XYRNO|nr:fibroin heavy chain isoform X3 [Xyrichtys novacula]
MLGRTLLQTSLVLWLAHQTLQGAVKPQTVSWGRVLPARGVGVGVKPGVTGALGAIGNRYGNKAMKAGLGRYPGAQLGVGGYRSLGLGGRAGLKQGGYATPGAYGASLGTGLPLGTGFTNGLGLGLGQGAKRGYGAGLGAVPGYGTLAGIGYPGARPGLSTAEDLGGPAVANLGQAVQELKRDKSSQSYGRRERTGELEMPSLGRSGVLGPAAPETSLRELKSLDPLVKSTGLRSLTHLDKQGRTLSQGRQSYEPTLTDRRGSTNHGATLAARGLRQQQVPLIQANTRTQGSPQIQHTGEYDSLIQRRPNCGSSRDFSDVLEMNHHEHLGSETQRAQGMVPRPHAGKDSKHLGHAVQPAQGEQNYQLPLPQTQEGRDGIFSLSQGQAPRRFVSAVADGQAVRDLGASPKGAKGSRIHGAIVVEDLTPSALNIRVQGVESHAPVSASRTQSLGIASIRGQAGEGVTVDGQEQKQLVHSEHDLKKSKALSIPGQTGRSNQAPSYIGGAGSYLGAQGLGAQGLGTQGLGTQGLGTQGLGTGGYGAGVGQGAYLGATGKLGAAAGLGQGGYPLGIAERSTGYGDGVTGYLGAMAGNGLSYGNGFTDGFGAALSTGAYAGQVQGALGALGTGLESAGGKYVGGAAQVPYGAAPVIPTGLEGEGGYPLAAQQVALGAEGAKTANKYVAGARYGAQQTGYGAQLGATQDALGEETGKFGGVNAALGNGYKG